MLCTLKAPLNAPPTLDALVAVELARGTVQWTFLHTLSVLLLKKQILRTVPLVPRRGVVPDRISYIRTFLLTLVLMCITGRSISTLN